MAHGTALKSFPFLSLSLSLSLFFLFLFLLGYSVGFFSLFLSLLSLISLGFWGMFSYHHPDILCCLSYILKVLPILLHCLHCLAFVFLHWCFHLPLSPSLRFGDSSFCSVRHLSFSSSLTPLALFFILCARSLLSCCVTVHHRHCQYLTSALSFLFYFLFYLPSTTLLRIDDPDINATVHRTIP